MLFALEENSVSNTGRVSGELGISQSSVVYYCHDFGKRNQSCQIVSSYQNIAKLLTHLRKYVAFLPCRIFYKPNLSFLINCEQFS